MVDFSWFESDSFFLPIEKHLGICSLLVYYFVFSKYSWVRSLDPNLSISHLGFKAAEESATGVAFSSRGLRKTAKGEPWLWEELISWHLLERVP